jgi:hypothetical protein
MACIYFAIYGGYALCFWYGTTLILQGRAKSGDVVTVLFSGSSSSSSSPLLFTSQPLELFSAPY